MKVFTSFMRHLPDTVRGAAVTVSTTYSSFDEAEIDKLEDQLREQIGAGLIGEITLNEEGEEGNNGDRSKELQKMQKII